jgi:hypothetical protein
LKLKSTASRAARTRFPRSTVGDDFGFLAQ